MPNEIDLQTWHPVSDTPEGAEETIEKGQYDYLLSDHFVAKYALLAGLANTFSPVLLPHVADLGCGYPVLPACGLRFSSYVAVDHCRAFFDDGKPRVLSPTPMSGIRWIVADVMSWDPGPLRFDVVISAGLSNEYGHKDSSAVPWMVRCAELTKPSGILILESSSFPVRGVADFIKKEIDIRYVTDGVLHLDTLPFYGPWRMWAVYRRAG